MKRRINFFMLILFALCGIFAGIKLPTFVAHAASTTASVWDGESVDKVTNADYFEDGNSIYIRSAKGFVYFAQSVNAEGSFRTYVGTTIYLETDIDLAGHEWTPIGKDDEHVFQGTFNGAETNDTSSLNNGHFIYNLKISKDSKYVGLFGNAGPNSRILNTHIRNVNISCAATYAGAVVGQISSTSADAFSRNSVSHGNITINAQENTQYVGGLVGYSTCPISSCFANANITANDSRDNSAAGGLVGYMHGTSLSLSNSFAEGTLNAYCQYSGGLVGISDANLSVADCYSNVNINEDIDSSKSVGGIVGKSNAITFNHTYNIGSLPNHTATQQDEVHAFIGYVDSSATIRNSFYVYSEADYGVAGKTSFTTDSVYAIKQNTNEDNMAKTSDYYLSSSRWKETWDINTVSSQWRIGASINNSYPYLYRTLSMPRDNNDADMFLSGDGTVTSPYIIETAGDLAAVADFYNTGKYKEKESETGEEQTYYFSLKNDISLLGRAWQPIGFESNNAFNGVFDGNGHAISDLTCSPYEPYTYHGLFGITNSAVIKNLTVENVRFLSEETNGSVRGNLIGYVEGKTYLINCADYGGIDGVNTVGNVNGDNLYVVYGKNNVTVTGTLIQDNIKIDAEFSKAYEVTIDGRGGTFYKTYKAVKDASGGENSYIKEAYNTKKGVPYFAEYKVVWEYAGESGSSHRFTLNQDIGMIDDSYGKTLLPQDTDKWGEEDVLVLPGNKLNGFTYSKRSEDVEEIDGEIVIESTSEDAAAATIIGGLYAKWTSNARQKVRVYYNQYEKDMFGAVADRSAPYINTYLTGGSNSEIIRMDGEGRIYVDYDLEYNSYLSDEANAKVFATPEYSSQIKIRKGFDVDAIYRSWQETSFQEEITKEDALFVNSNLATLYAEWKGDKAEWEEEGTDAEKGKSSLNVVFKNDGKHFEVKDAVLSAKLTTTITPSSPAYTPKPTEDAEDINTHYQERKKDEDLIENASGGMKFVFDYFYDVSGSKNEYANLYVDLANGFRLDPNNPVVVSSADDLDTNFGTLTYEGSFIDLDNFNMAVFYNFVGEVTITLNIDRKSYTDDLSVDKSLVFGVGVFEEVAITQNGESFSSNVRITSGAQIVDLLSLTSTTLQRNLKEYIDKGNPLYVGFDFVKNLIIFSNDTHDKISFSFANSGTFSFGKDGGERISYSWIKDNKTFTEGGSFAGFTLSINKSLSDGTQDSVFEYNYYTSEQKYVSLTYPAMSSFVFILDSDIQGGQTPPINISSTIGNLNTLIQGSAQGMSLKTLAKFENIVRDNKSDEKGYFKAFSTFDKAYVNVRFVTKEGDDIQRNAPTFKMYSDGEESSEFDLGTPGHILLEFTDTKYYEVSKDFALFDGGENYTLKFDILACNYNQESLSEYRTNFQDNTKFFTPESQETNSLTLSYKPSIDEFGGVDYREGWQPGLYQLSVVCQEAKYNVSVRNVFVDVDGNKVDYVPNSEIQTSVTIPDGTKNAEDNEDATVSYETPITVETTLGDNHGFVFKGWNFDGATDFQDNANINATARNLSFSLNQTGYAGFVEETKDFVISAVYTVKQVEVLPYRSYTIIEGETERYESGKLTYDLTGKAIYNYSTQNTNQTDLNIQLKGKEYKYYYIAGYKIVRSTGVEYEIGIDEENPVKKFIRDEDLEGTDVSKWNDFSVDEALEYIIKNDVTTTTTKQVYISPILKKKTITLMFHSGTGNDANKYGDKMNGTVYANSQTETTGMTVTIENPNSTIYLNTYLVDLGSSQITIDQFFNSRVGYSKPNQNYWKWTCERDSMDESVASGSILYSQLSLIPDMYDFMGTSGTVHFYIDWQPNTYNVTFQPNGGSFLDSDLFKRIEVKYDSVVNSWIIPTNITRNGYTFDGWGIGGNKIFDKNGTIINDGTVEYDGQVYFSSGNYRYPNNLVLDAIWSPNQYNLVVDYNSGKDTTGQTSTTYSLYYDGTFASVLNEDGTLLNQIVSRDGYIFDGFYAINNVDDSISQRITSTTIFNSNLLGFQFGAFTNPGEVPALTIYARWRFDVTYFSLSLNDNRHENLEYIAAEQNVYYADFFAQDNVTAQHVVVNAEKEAFRISLDVEDTKLSLMIDSQPQEEFRNYFVVKNAGTYQVLFEIILTDQAEKFNLGEVRRFSFTLYVTVNGATILGDESLNENTFAQNIVKIIKPYVDLDELGIVEGQNLSTVVSKYKTYEGEETFAEAEDMQVYEYIMMKYYLLLTTTVANDFNTYKNWTYSDYLAYKQSHETTVESRLDSLKLFTYFDYFNQTQSVQLDEYVSGITIKAKDIDTTELTPTKVVLNSLIYNIAPFSLYDVRVYVAENENVSNYSLRRDENGLYFVIGSGYVLPQVLTLKNQIEKPSVYYSQYYSNREVNFELEYETYTDGDLEYYNIDGVYISARLYSSDIEIGKYKFASKENYLFFDNVDIALMEDEQLLSSRNFAIVLDKTDTFEILSVEGVASLNVSAKYLTENEGSTSFADVDENVLYISSLTYFVESAVTINPIDNPEAFTVGMHTTLDGVQLYQIERNNSNQVVVYLNQLITNIVVSTTQTRLSNHEYASLYKWSENQIYNVDGTMETKDNISFTRAQLEQNKEEGELAQTIYYAVYTDLVYVEYNLNFPESYTDSLTSNSTLKLGESTYDSLYWPYEQGVGQATSMFLVLNGNEYNISQNQEMLFRENGVFVGLKDDNRYQKVVLSCKWTISTELNYVQLLEDEKLPVGAYRELSFEDVVYLYNLNEEMFTYSSVWQKLSGDEYEDVSQTNYLTLEHGGSVEDGGNFKLHIVAKLREEFYQCLDENSPKEYTVDIDFSLTFMKNIIDSVEFTPVPVTYDAKDHSGDVVITVLYRVWEGEDYGMQNTRQLSIAQTDFIPLQVMFNGAVADMIRNAGTYTINLSIDDSKFECGVDVTKSFEFVINKREVDLDNAFTATKVFGTSDPSLEMNYAVRNENILVENITLSLTRGQDPSEEIGESALYLASVGDAFKGNYIFKSNGVVIFDGEAKPEALENSVGTFTITQGDTLRVFYNITESDPAVYAEEYAKGGFTAAISVVGDNLVLQIKQNGTVKHQFTLVLSDASGGALTNEKVLDILKTNFDATIQFIIGDRPFEVAEDVETYNYSLSNGAKLSTYYRNVEISLDYKFQITKKIIDVAGITYTKTFDNTNVATISFDGQEINPEGYNGLYIKALYSSVHASESTVRVDLSLEEAGESEKATNYDLSTKVVDWKVEKLSATMTLEIDTEKYKTETPLHFIYGAVNVSNLTVGDFVKIKEIMAGEKIVTEWLYDNYYTLELKHNADSVSEKGFLYKGTYTLTPTYTFQDFDMTIEAIQFDVDVLNVPRELQKNFVVITVLDKVAASYSDTVTLSTGEVLNLEYTVKDQEAGTTLPEGNYDLQLPNNTFLNESVVVTITNEDNDALGVVKASETVYARIVDKNADTLNPENMKVVYSKETYTFTLTDNENLVLNKNSQEFRTFTIKYFTKADAESETPVSDPASLGTITISTSSEMLAVGKYNLSISMTSSSYANIIFVENYVFEIAQIEIEISRLNISKTYDRSRDLTIKEFDRKISGEDVSIIVRFDDADANTGKHAEIFLDGVDRNNYKPSVTSVDNGEITPAQATISLSNLNYDYGQITKDGTSAFQFSVQAGTLVVPSAQYKLSVEIENSKSSSSANRYLDAGQYKITVTVAEKNTNNFEIQSATFQINVKALSQSLVFENNGMIQVGYGSVAARNDTFTYNMTSTLGEKFDVTLKRTSGTEIGYYKILSSDFVSEDSNYTISSVVDNSSRGAFQIIRQSDRVFVLFKDGTTTLEVLYNGMEYNTVALTAKEDGYYMTISHTSGLSTVLEKKLGFFYLEGGEYKEYEEDFDVVGLSATLQFLNYPLIKQKGDYNIQARSATSSTHDVKMGKDGTLYAFTFTISQVPLQLKDEFATEIVKPFNFQKAVYEYADASELFQELTEEDGITATVAFFQDDNCENPAIFVGGGYRIVITLRGANAENYILPDYLSEPNGKTVEKKVTGRISLAEVTFYINNLSFTYGEDFDLNSFVTYDVGFEGFNLANYKDQRSWELDLTYKYQGEMSSSGKLPAGDYDLVLTFRATDFVATTYIVDNTENEELTAKLSIKPRKLQLVETTKKFEEMFIKTYDETADVVDAFTEGMPNFDISGVIEGDDVQVASAVFENAQVGNPKKVKFTLKSQNIDSQDFKNYTLEDYEFGAINPIEIYIHFNYDDPVISNVESDGLPQLESIGFPFTSISNLTSNSMDEKTQTGRSFPTTLKNNAGFGFLYWTIDFNIVGNQQKIDKLKALIASAGLELDELSNEEAGLYKICVANNAKTVEFIRLLVNDNQDFPEFYFKTQDKIQIDFQPNWETVSVQLEVSVADENGSDMALGLVSVNGSENAESFSHEMDYNKSVTVKVKANAHASYYGFYIYSDGEWKNAQNIDGVNITYADGYDMQLSMNLTENTNIQVRFAVQKVAVNISLDGIEAQITSSTFKENGGNYTWNTDYFTLQTFAASALPSVVRTGFNHTGYTCDDVALTEQLLSEFVKDNNPSTSITLVPTFERQKLNVTLNFNYVGAENKTIVVEYGLTYSSSAEWEANANPSRNGFNFLGWQKDGVTINAEENVVTESHILTAQWEIHTFTVKFVVENATIQNSSKQFEFDGTNTYEATGVEYAQKITFTVNANTGYMISSTWAEDFEVSFDDEDDKTSANVAFTMPDLKGDVYEYTLPIIPISNKVTIISDHVANVEAYNNSTSNDIEVTEKTFNVPTGNRFTITLTAEMGYEFEGDITISVEGVTKTVSTADKQLVIQIESINSDIEITVSTKRSLNQVSIAFNTPSQIKSIIYGGTTYSSLSNLQPFEVVTGENFVFYVTFEYGYTFDRVESDHYMYSGMPDDSGFYGNGAYRITVSGINQNGTVTIYSKTAKFIISADVITWDNNHDRVTVEGNIAYVDGGTEPVNVDYQNTVTFTYTEAANYYFAGWSRDGIEIFSSLRELVYTVEKDETIYAIFSASQYMFSLGTLSVSDVSVGDGTQTIFSELRGLSAGSYTDIDGKQIQDVQVYFGANAIVMFNVPQGFVYAGYGYYDLSGNFVYINQEAKSERTVEVNITTQSFGEGVFKIYFVVSAYSIIFDVQTQVNINSNREDNNTIGIAQIVEENGEDAKENGYVEGARTHYMSTGAIDYHNFSIVSYTGDKMYLKIVVQREGYVFDGLICAEPGIIITKTNIDGLVYEISNYVGAMDKRVKLYVVFKPIVNLVELSFENNSNVVEGGVFDVSGATANDSTMISTSGTGKPLVNVYALTDSRFVVHAYIKLGYFVNDASSFVIIDENGIVEQGATYTAFSESQMLSSGFTGMLTFTVSHFLNSQQIKIRLNSSKYIIKLRDGSTAEEDGGTLLATIKNVEFGGIIDLTYDDDIEIEENRLSVVDGKLNIIIKRNTYNFEGYFTQPNGAGVRYFDTEGNLLSTWQESGFSFNQQTKLYERSPNAYFNEVTGEVEISLYLYMSYLKTRIRFSIIADIYTNITAQDIVSGVDVYNSWYYSSQPLYMEVSFGTNIYFNAPEIDGFAFYRFVINQRPANGDWFAPAYSYSERTPWSTNQLDNFVECEVQIVYFAQADVRIVGGEASYTITQEDSNTQALLLLNKGFVDTSKQFVLTAEAAEGYKFISWTNTTTGYTSARASITQQIQSRVIFVLALEGLPVNLDFTEYDTRFGQIVQINITPKNDTKTSYSLGHYNNVNEFVKDVSVFKAHVGDLVEFVLNIERGFAVVWESPENMMLDHFENQRYVFTLTLSGNISAEETLQILPRFENEILSVYITEKLADGQIIENAFDLNSVVAAGRITSTNGMELTTMTVGKDEDIVLLARVNQKYKISNITLENYGLKFEDMDILYSEGRITISKEYRDSKAEPIIGTILLTVEYSRLLWEEDALSDVEFEGAGTIRNPYQISSAAQLSRMMQLVNSGASNDDGAKYKDACYVLTADIDLSEKYWTPIGTAENMFGGQFNFNNHTVTNIQPYRNDFTPLYNDGLFGYLADNAKIILSETSLWYIYLIIGLGVGLIALLVVLILVNYNKKKRREELSKR